MIITAYAASVEAGQACERLEADYIEVDGMLDDWKGIRGKRAGGTSRDASYAVRCGYDDRALYVAIDVRDQRVLRGARANAKTDDHLTIDLSVGEARTGRIEVFPGAGKAKSQRRFRGKRVPKWLRVQDSLQPRGWSVELSIPRARIRGLDAASPGVTARVIYRDADLASEGKIQDVVTWKGVLEIGDGAAVYRAFLAASGLSERDVRLDVMAEVDGAKGQERVVAGGAVIGVISDEFTYVTLPAKPGDVKDVRVVELRADGTASILAVYRERGGGGSRDVVTVWNPDGTGRFNRVLAFEVRKQLGDRRVVNRWRLVPRGKHRRKAARTRRGKDILIEVAERDVTGWDEDNYGEAPARDVHPILLPWTDQTSAVFWFEGNAVLGGEPAR